MSVEALSIVLHHSRAKGTAKLVLLGIANHHGDGGAWPAVDTLARYANVTVRNAQKALDTLVGMGEVERFVQGGGLADFDDYLRPNRYVVRVTCPPWCDRTMNHRDTRSRQAPLWKNRVSKSTPGVGSDRGGVSESTGEGVSHATPKPSIEPDDDQVPASTTDRARDERPAEPVDLPDLDGLRARLRDQTAQFSHREDGPA